jgi:hypothetical protein
MDTLPLPISTLPQPLQRQKYALSPEKYTGYEARVVEDEGRTLKYYTDIANSRSQREEEERLITNMSLTLILENISKTIIAIINDIVSGNATTPSELFSVFFRDNRMMYIGFVLMFIAFSIYLVSAS